MSADFEAGRREGSRGRLMAVLLTLSLTLNVFFIGGLVWTRHHMPPPMMNPVERFQSVGDEMHLAGDQRAGLRQFIDALREHNRAMREQNRPLIEAMWSELAKAEPDQAKIEELIDQANANRRAAQKETEKSLTAFLATLPPEQRAQFADLAQKHRPENLR
ncbi:MAG TPA: periplasmic heavy metal sensor [Stellaceae bacterium]|nr:periplasmic heavy metal sensor [Stellaceae bacterium]